MLFDKFNLAGLTLGNRIVRSATHDMMADSDGRVTEQLIERYAALALGGAGLIITGFGLVHPGGRAAPKMISAHGETFIPGLRRLAGAVHEAGGLIALQLAHGGRQSPPLLLGGAEPLAPSAIRGRGDRAAPRAMTDPEIWEVVDAFAEAAWRARTAGFDAVQLHSAHGYLISSFLSPYTNRRDDYWGGDELRRTHFIEEVLKATREAVGKDFPILAKINTSDLLPDGLGPEESLGHVKRCLEVGGKAGLDAVELSGGMIESRVKTIRPGINSPKDEAYFREAGGLFKSELPIPVILTGGMRTRAVMEGVLASGEADLIGISRPLIREPDLPRLMQGGRDAADCISCNKCIRYSRLKYVRCKQLHDEAHSSEDGA